MDTLKKTHNTKLPQDIIFYLDVLPSAPSEVEEILFNNVKAEIDDMLSAGVIMPIIFTYILTVLQMIKVTKNYDLVINCKKIERLLSIIYSDETERKTAMQQIIAYCLRGQSVALNKPGLADAIKSLGPKTEM